MASKFVRRDIILYMHLPLSVLSAVAFVVITSSYTIIQCIINPQVGSARSPEDPYMVILHKDNIAVDHVCHVVSCICMIFYCILRGQIKGFNSSITIILFEVGSYRTVVG